MSLLNSLHLKVLTSSDAPLQFYPTWDYYGKSVIHREFSRGQEGQLNTFMRAGSYNEFFLPSNFVSSADANTINGWWQNQSDLDLTVNSGDASQLNYTVKIINKMTPFGKNVEGSFVNYYGSIILKTI
jgi:hypothetical protein